MQKTKIHRVRLTQQQHDALQVLKKYNVNLSSFIRDAISVKIKTDWKGIKEKKEKFNCPF